MRRLAKPAATTIALRLLAGIAGAILSLLTAAPAAPSAEPRVGFPGRIAFGRVGGEVKDRGVFVMDADGTRSRRVSGRLTTEIYELFQVDWSPNFQWIAFQAYSTKAGSGIFKVKPSGKGLKKLTEGGCLGDYAADWAPDGDRIAFRRETCESNRLFTVRAAGKGERQLSSSRADEPVWHPDGVRILYWNNGNIFITDRDGSEHTKLTATHRDGAGSFSPSGSQIVFSRRRGKLGSDIWILRPDGSGLRRLTGGVDLDGDPEYRPDGRRIVFVSNRSGDRDIFVMHPDGSRETALTSNDVHDFDPTWSPDGKAIAFLRRSEGRVDLYVMKADGTGLLRLTDSPLIEENPAWGR